jgi:hypothetical protein
MARENTATVHDTGLNQAFLEGLTESTGDILNQAMWVYVVEFGFEGTTFRIHRYDNTMEMLKAVAEHMANGPGTAVTVSCTTAEAQTKPIQAELDESNVIEGEVVSDE